MADKLINEFATVEEALDDDLLLVSSNDETYNIKVKTLKKAVAAESSRAADAAEAAQEAAEEAAETAESAVEIAESAVATANTANGKADTALSTANTANTKATAAQSAASSAAASASSANTAAQAASAALQEANELLEELSALGNDVEEMKEALAGKIDDAYVDDGYLYLMAGDEVAAGPLGPFSGGGGGGGTTSAAITLANVLKPSSVRNGADAIFGFTATSTDDTNISVLWYVDGVLKSTVADKASGTSFTFNAKDHLRQSDTSTVKAVISSESGATLNRQWNITSSAFSLAWGSAIQPITLYTANENVYIVVNVSAQARTTNTVILSIGEEDFEREVTGSRAVTFEIDKAMFETGINTITAVMVSGTDEDDETDPISFVAIWGYGADEPIVAFAKSSQNTVQYDNTTIQFFVFDPDNETANCAIQIGSESARSLIAGRTLQSISYAPQDYGNKTVTLTCGDSSDTMTLVITQSQYDIGMVTGDNLRYLLNPTGHANTDSDRADFGDLSFSDGFDWINGGFAADENGTAAFVIKKGNHVTLPRALFEDSDGNGKTVDVSFKIANSDTYDAVAMSELNNGASKGIILRANEGELRLNNTTGQLFRYCEESRIDLSVNVEEVNDHRVMTVWLDGIPSLVQTYTSGTLVQDENNLVIGSDHCDVWIYAIRVYNTALSYREMLQNYISLGATTAEKIERYKANDIYDDNGNITPSTLHEACPDLTIVKISADRMTTGKKDPVNAVVTIQDGAELLELENNTTFQVQGTSSAAYGRSAFNLDINFKNSGKEYAISQGAIPVNYLNIKVNVASSECANNICAADMYNQYQPYIVPARETAGVRDTVEGKPCAVFFTNTSTNTIWIGSQQLQPGDTVLYAMGDICNSKKNLVVFGQDGTGEHYAKGCIEVSGNDTPAQQFKATSTYNSEDGEWQTVNGTTVSTDYEWRAEPKAADLDAVVGAWDDTVEWLVSTAVDLATPETALDEAVTYGGVEYTHDTAQYRLAKFKAEVGDYFAIDSLLYHFLWMEFYAAFDNVSKNTFYSFEWDETAGKYLWNINKNYDDDTILGCDNDGVPLADYGADFGDTAGSRSLFNADSNTIWVNIQSAFASELAAMYIMLRGRGAWTAQTIINKWNNYQSIRPHAAMAEDAYNKYILPYKTTGVTVGTEVKSYDDSYLARLQGSKKYQRNQFVTYQAKYMDGKYGYYSTSESITFRANAPAGTTQDLIVKAYAKTYVTIIVDNGTRVSKKIATGGTATFQNTAVHSNATIYVTPESLIQSITPIDSINNSTFAAAGASKLQEVMLGAEDSENTAWDANTGLNIPTAILTDLSIRNLVNFSRPLDLSANVELETVDTRGTNAGLITLPAYAPLTDIHLNACSGIVALDLLDVESFSMANGNNLTTVRVENCNSIVNAAMATLLEQAVSYGGNATHYIRYLGADLTFTTGDALYAIASKWKGYNALGEASNTPVITGECYIGSLSQAELTAIETAFPELEVTYGSIVPAYTVTFKNYDGTVLNTQTIKRNSAAVNPITAELISTPTKASTVAKTYEFSGWDVAFNHILQDTIVTAQFTESDRYYTIRYYDGTVVVQTNSVIAHGSSNYTGAGLSGSGIWTGWDETADDVVSDMDIHAVYVTPVLPDTAVTEYDYLYSDDPEDDSAYSLAEFYGIMTLGNPKTYFTVGDKIKIVPHTNVFADLEIVLQLYGFNHFKISGSNNFAGCTFGMLGIMNANHRMNASNTNVGGWKSCEMRTWLNSTILSALPVYWQSMIKSVDVISSIGNTSALTDTTSDKLFLFSYAEVGFSANEVPYKNEVDADAEQKTFALFTSNTSRIKKTYNGEGSASSWWLRSPLASSSSNFCFVDNFGGSASNAASNSYGVAFGFCI